MSLSTLQEQSAKIRYIENQLHTHMSLYGYDHISLPFIEPADIFLTRAGDKIIDRLFTFDRFGHQLALRPEFTAAAANLYVQSKKSDVARWQFSGSIFEDDVENPSLEYQRYSIGAECIGLNGIQTDAETIAMAVEGIKKIGIQDWKLIIGHVGLQLHLLSRFNLDSRTYRILLSQRNILKNPGQGKAIALNNLQQLISVEQTDESISVKEDENGQTQHMLDVLLDSTRYGTTMGGRTRHDIAQRLLNKSERALTSDQLHAALDFFADWVNLREPADKAFIKIEGWIGDDKIGQSILSDWQKTITLLEAYGIDRNHIIIQADLTKNWEYYTGIVFGIEVDDNKYVIGGGRYDELTRILGSEQNIPAIGFAYYVDEILPVVEHVSEKPETIYITGEKSEYVIQWATFLRENDIPVVITQPNQEDPLIIVDDNRACIDQLSFTFDERDALLKEVKTQQ